MNRASTVSMIPPKYPAISPTATPSTVAISVVTMPTNSEMRAPYRTRTSRSRPVESVPRRNPLTPGPTGLPSSLSPWTG